MLPDPNRVESIFAAAAAIASAERRAGYLDGACLNEAGLRARVEALLSAHGDAGDFLEAAANTAGLSPITEGPGTLIGPYKLLQKLGEGGMGVVYMAEQQEPVRRKVALKIIKPGMDSREVIARFEAERQALAMMDHVNIAKVFEAGATDTSRPYFVMELVHGVSITKYCDDNRLTPRQRLELFIPVCQAVQHAHQKGIIHRDIKPSNVMVTMYDDKPVPKIIDFGVAKAVEQRLTEKSLFTQYGAMVGTFEYMSPEQAELNAFGVDTRSDIYSLGVLLYELLTGTTPLERQRLREAAYGEIVRLIKEEEPVRPSMRLSTSGAALAGISRERGTEPAKLAKLVKGDLDWIVMRCLEKDRARRYDTVTGLAQDIQHYLAEEPVLACPPSAWYRFRKMARRNKAAMVTAGLVAATLLLGIIGTSFGLVQAIQSAADALAARDEEAQQRRVAARALTDVEAAEQKEKWRAGELALALEDLKKANLEEKDARHKAQKNAYRAESQLYSYNLASAQRELEAKNVPLFYHYLEQCRPDFRGWEHDYLYTLLNQNQQTLWGHAGGVGSVAFSPDGKLLASVDMLASPSSPKGARTVRLWDAVTGKEVDSRPWPSSTIVSVAFSPDGKRLAAAAGTSVKVGFKPTVTLWDVVTAKNAVILNEVFRKGPEESINCIAFSPDGKHLAMGGGPLSPKKVDGFPNTVTLWDAATGKEIQALHGHTNGIRGVAFSPDGRRLASASHDMTVKLWELASGREYLTLKGHAGFVTGVAFSPDGKRLATSSVDKTIKLWDAASGRELLSLSGHEGEVRSVAFSPDGKLLASASADETVKLWDVAKGRDIITFKGHRGKVHCVVFSPDGKRLASAGIIDGTVKLWNVAASPRTIAIKEPGVHAVLFSPNGKLLAVSDHPPRTLIQGISFKFKAANFTPRNQMVKQWHLPSTEAVLVREIEESSELAVSAGGIHLAGGRNNADGHTLKLWDAATGQEQGTVRGLTGFVQSLAVSPDGKLLASALVDGTVNVWNAANGDLVLTHKEEPPILHKKEVWYSRALAFSPDGNRLAYGDADKKVTIWDLGSKMKLLSLQGDDNRRAFRLVFSPDGKRLACAWAHSSELTSSASPTEPAPSMVTIWDMANGNELWTLKHVTDATSLVFSPDAKRLVGAVNGPGKAPTAGVVKFWDAASGQELLTLRVASPVIHLTFSPDGKRLASGADDGTILIWDASNSMKELEQN